MSHASNRGTFEALEFGMVTSCSAMMPTSWVPEFDAHIRMHPDTEGVRKRENLLPANRDSPLGKA